MLSRQLLRLEVLFHATRQKWLPAGDVAIVRVGGDVPDLEGNSRRLEGVRLHEERPHAAVGLRVDDLDVHLRLPHVDHRPQVGVGVDHEGDLHVLDEHATHVQSRLLDEGRRAFQPDTLDGVTL